MKGKLCECGRRLAKASERHLHLRDRHYVYHRCQCGNEWTTEEIVADVRDPVSSDEVLDVRSTLEKFEGPLSDLIP